MSGRLLEIAVRPTRIAFLLGRNPSKRLINSVISVNSGLWGGIYNFICPSNGRNVVSEYIDLLKYHNPDCVVFCGRFNNKQNIVRQFEEHDIHPCFFYKSTTLSFVERFGIGVEGVFDSRFMQAVRHGTSPYTAVVDTRRASATILDKVIHGMPPERLKKYMEGRVDLITLTRYRKELQRDASVFDEIIGTIQITGNNLVAYRLIEGRRLPVPPYRFGRLYFVIGTENSLEDACYFWNLRAIFGVDRIKWIELSDLESFLTRRETAYTPMLTLTSAPGGPLKEIERILEKLKTKRERLRHSPPRAILRTRANLIWESELRREHMATSEGELVLPISRPSHFELIYPQRYPRWVMDLRIIRDDAIGTEGFVLPSLPYLFYMVTPGRGAHLQPRMRGDTISLQVVSGRVDEPIRFKVPTDWEVIQAIFAQSNYRICLSDQGNYMSRALAFFSGLPRLSLLLRDHRVIAIFDEFLKHHHTKESLQEDGHYRRALTLDDMRKAVTNTPSRMSRRDKERNYSFVDELLKELIKLGAIHSGYMLDCSKCKLEEWYPIDEVSEDFRCRRCLVNEIRPLSPLVSFRLNEALYQAYLHNFTVPTLVLDVLHKNSNTSFIFSPQIKLDETNIHSPEIDIVALCDGVFTIGEAKSTDRISKDQIECLESTAPRVKAQRIVIGTTSRHSCHGIDCGNCSKNANYADNAFTHGSSKGPRFWGTREHIQDLRRRIHREGVEVTSICAEDILLGGIQRNRRRRIFVPTRQP